MERFNPINLPMPTFVQLLGSPSISHESDLHSLPTSLAAALCYYLIYEGTWKTREELAYLFWPDTPEANARKNLRNLLGRIRKFTFADNLEVEQSRIRWQVETDVSTFKEFVPRNDYAKAIQSYQGDLLTNFHLDDALEFNHWLEAEREELRRLYQKAVLNHVEALASQNLFEEAAEVLEPLRKANPFDENLLRHQLDFLQAANQREQALQIFEQFTEVLERELGATPELATLEIIEQLQQEASPTSKTFSSKITTPRIHNLPEQPTRFVGRQVEKLRIGEQLADPSCRLLTLVGSGGIGKTRLALAVANEKLTHFKDGVFFVALARISSPEQIPFSIADALNISLTSQPAPSEQLLAYLRDKSILLILDNLEHLSSGYTLISQLLEGAPKIKVLATSREFLNLRAEWLFSLSGLSVSGGESSEKGLQADAALLLRQVLHQHQYKIKEDETPYVRQICQLVEGMPLALELAGGWVEVLSLEEIAAEIEKSLDFLESASHDLPQRQRSIRAVFNSSWVRLSKNEQALFMKLSLFRGGFTREAAQVVTGTTLQILRSLVNKSFITTSAEGRYSIHELLRQYAYGILQTSGEFESSAKLYSTYYLDLVASWEPDLKGSSQLQAFQRVETDLENIRAAWRWAAKFYQWEKLEKSLNSLYYFYWARGRLAEGHHAIDEALTMFEDRAQEKSALFTRLQLRQGALLWSQGSDAFMHLNVGLNLALEQELTIETAFAYLHLGNTYRVRGEFETAESHYLKGLALYESNDDLAGKAQTLLRLGWLYEEEKGDHKKARSFHEQSLELYRETGNQAEMAMCLDKLAHNLWKTGNYTDAERYCRESLDICYTLDNRLGISLATGSLGYIVWKQNNNLREAYSLIAKSLKICRETGQKVELCNRCLMLGEVSNALEHYDESEKLFLESFELAEETSYEAGKSMAMAGLGDRACTLGKQAVARNYLRQALTYALHSPRHHIIIYVIIEIAPLLIAEHYSDTTPGTQKDNSEKLILAATILGLVIHHPTTWQYIRDKGKNLYEHLTLKGENKQTTNVIYKAYNKGKHIELGTLIKALELEFGLKT